MRARIRNLEGLTRIFRLSQDEYQAVASHKGPLPVGITPYYASLMDPDNPFCPVRMQSIPVAAEAGRAEGEYRDPLRRGALTPLP